MADNLNKAPHNDQLMKKAMTALGKRSLQHLTQRLWYSEGVPAVDAGSQATYPVATGDFAYDITNNHVYVCTVAPTAGVAATFVKMHA
jgi:hypothetical protein